MSLTKKLHFILSSIIIFCFVSCKNEPDLKIGLLMDSYVQERWTKDRDIFVAKVNELGMKVIDTAAGSNHQKQVELAKWLIDKGVKTIVIVAVDHEKAAEIVELAHDAGVKVIAYDRLIKNCDLDFYISFNNIDVGKSQAKYLVEKQPGGNYMLLGGSNTDNNAYLLQQGQMEVLKPFVDSGDINIIMDIFLEKWDKTEAYDSMIRYIEQNDTVKIDAVIAGNDDLAAGALNALQEKGIEDVLIAGQDADLEACKRILKGQQEITVYKDIRKLAEKAAKVAVDLTADGQVNIDHAFTANGQKEVPSYLLESSVYDRDILVENGNTTE